MLCFANIDRNNSQSDNYKIPTELADLIGLSDERIYNVKNIAAYERSPDFLGRKNAFLWPIPISGIDLKQNGFFVSMSRVPQDVNSWNSAPYEAQYLKLYDVTDGIVNDLTDVAINSHSFENDGIRLNFETIPGHYYHLENNFALASGTWNLVHSNQVAYQTAMQFTNSTLENVEFFRVRKSENEM